MGNEKPRCKLIGEDGNVFNIIGLVQRALKSAGQKDEAKEFGKLAFKAKSYNEVLGLAAEYVSIC
jgi:hypothetical protein